METVVYNDFSGGWSGNLDLAKVAPNMYDARNMMLYRDGSLGPRPGLKEFNIGRSTTGIIQGIVHLKNNSDYGLVYVDGLLVCSVSDQNTGAGHDESDPIDGENGYLTEYPYFFYREDDETLYLLCSRTTGASGMWKFSPIDQIPPLQNYGADDLGNWRPAGTVYGVRFIRASRTQMIYSPPIEFGDWDSDTLSDNALNIRVNANSGISYMTLLKDNLVMVDEEGRFFTLSGVPGVNDTLRLTTVSKTRPNPIGMLSFVNTSDGLLHYLHPANNYPAVFDGLNHTEMPYLSLTPGEPTASYANSEDPADAHNDVVGFVGKDSTSVGFFQASSNRMLLQHLGAWGLHDMFINMSNQWASDGRGRLFAFSRYFGDGSQAAYCMDLRLGRPAFTTDTFASPGDASSTPLECSVVFPETWSEDSYLLKPTELVVDFKKWNTGSASDNRIQADVTVLARGFRPSTGTNVQSAEWTQDGSEAPATQDGEKDRWRMNLGGNNQEGAGFKVSLHGLRGVAITQVRVNYEKVVADGRYG